MVVDYVVVEADVVRLKYDVSLLGSRGVSQL